MATTGAAKGGGSSGLGNDLDFSALSALPVGRRDAVTTAANAAATTLGVSAQSIIDSLAVGRGLASLLPNDGCNLASSGGAVTSQGDPVGAIRSWTGVELATQANASLQPVSGADGVYADSTKLMSLGDLSGWMAGEGVLVSRLDPLATTFDVAAVWRTGVDNQPNYYPSPEFGTIQSSFGCISDRIASVSTVSPITKKILSFSRQTGSQLIVDVDGSEFINSAVTVGFFNSATLFYHGTFGSAYYGTISVFALNSTLYTTAQRAAIREFCKEYFGVTY